MSESDVIPSSAPWVRHELPQPDRTDGRWAVWNGYSFQGEWSWTVVASPDGVSHQNIWPGPRKPANARALAAALEAAAEWWERTA